MNNSGQALLFGIMLFLLAFIIVVITSPAIKSLVVDVRGADNLDCDSTTISTGTRITCLFIDLILPYFVGVVIASGAGYLFLRGQG